jgi:hypothetical protein
MKEIMSSSPVPEPVTRSQILFCQSENGSSHREVRLDEGIVWLTRALIAEPCQTTRQNVSLPVRNIIEDGEPKKSPQQQGNT